ncbi:hypothetical protein EAO69_41820 [Streptomyces sp. me109]|uniref:hypothetical protein n=1 Tax=Streptomyces sp. me109 TaxID=1827853 RepID=UPI0011CD8754|nr:hypothetical protein [Streptomyces sp. me109]TXS59474.1 hypothetical protein EAO69_41820 [Streptomyces sp. me109]
MRVISDAEFAVVNELFYVVEDFVAHAPDRDPGDVTELNSWKELASSSPRLVRGRGDDRRL